MADALERLKVLIDSSTPIVVMETVEEMRAVRMVRIACSSLNLATFEWSIASGLVRCGQPTVETALITAGLAEGAYDHPAEDAKALYNSRDPAQMLGNLEGLTLEAALHTQRLPSPYGRPGRRPPAAGRGTEVLC